MAQNDAKVAKPALLINNPAASNLMSLGANAAE